MSISGRIMSLSDTARGWRFPAAALASYYLALASRNSRGSDQEKARAVVQLCAAARLSRTDRRMMSVENRIAQVIEELDHTNIDWMEFDSTIHERFISKSAILKPWVSDNERGVLYISLCNEWSRLMVDCDINEVARKYTIVIAPGWSPPHDLMNYMLPRVVSDDIYCLISNLKDLEILPRISRQYRPVPLFASSWTNPERFRPIDFPDRDIDLIMVASFARYKRPFMLFNALRSMSQDLRVMLIGTETEFTLEQMRLLAREYQVEDKIEIHVGMHNDEVSRCLSRSKASVILSRREGSCVAIAESLFADTPVGVVEDAHIGSAAFINSQTGMFLRPQCLAEDIWRLISHAELFSPRAWANENITCYQSTKILNDQLKNDAIAEGKTWSMDIAVHHRCPYPRLLSSIDQHRMAGSYEDFQKRFGITLLQ